MSTEDQIKASSPGGPAFQPGHNRLAGINPETDLLAVSLDEIGPLLTLHYAELARRTLALRATALKWEQAHADPKSGLIRITSDAQMNAASDLFAQLRDHAGTAGEVETARKRVNEPVRHAVLAINAHFASLKDELAGSADMINNAQNIWMRSEIARKKAEADAQAAAARREAQRLLDEARKAEAPAAVIDQAIEAEAAADAAQSWAATPPRDMGRIRSALGTTTSAAASMMFKVTDIKALCRAVADGDAPVTFILTNDSAIRAAIKGKHGIRDVPGLEISEDITIRRRGP